MDFPVGGTFTLTSNPGNVVEVVSVRKDPFGGFVSSVEVRFVGTTRTFRVSPTTLVPVNG